MTDAVHIVINNQLIIEKRDINVYHNFTKRACIISKNSSVTIPLQPNGQSDYIHISVVRGPGDLWKTCILDLPEWVDFEFSSICHIIFNHSGGRLFLKIPPGPPTWELKITSPIDAPAIIPVNGDFVAIGDQEILKNVSKPSEK